MQLKKGSCNFFTCVNSKAGTTGINVGTLGTVGIAGTTGITRGTIGIISIASITGIAGTTSYKGIQYVDGF